jgi:hypothetical protein
VIERIDDMPAGTIGLEASGKLTRDDYRRVLAPALREGIDTGELRLLFALPDFDGLEPAALPEDLKTGSPRVRTPLGLEAVCPRHRRRGVATAMHMFAWMTPGDVMICGLDELEDPKAWVAG